MLWRQYFEDNIYQTTHLYKRQCLVLHRIVLLHWSFWYKVCTAYIFSVQGPLTCFVFFSWENSIALFVGAYIAQIQSFCLFFKLVFVGPFWNFILEHVVEIWATVGEWKSPIVVHHNVGDDVVWWRVTNVWGISLIVYHSIKDDLDIRVAAVGGKSSMTCEGHKADTAQEGELSGFLAVQVLSLKLVHLWLRKGKHC